MPLELLSRAENRATIALRGLGADDLCVRPKVAAAIERHTARLTQLLPGSEAEHIGATAVPGALTKGDLDLLVRVPAERFEGAVEALKSYCAPSYPDDWTASRASFKEQPEVDVPVGIQLVIAGSADDRLFVRWRELLRENRGLHARYNEFKSARAGENYAEYTKAKGEFIEQALAEADPDVRLARNSDYGAIAELWTEAFVRSGDGGRNLAYLESDVSASAQAGELFVVEATGEIAGVAALMPGGLDAASVSRSGEAEVTRLAVAPNQRRQGYARKLLSHCHTEARARGSSGVVLWSRPAQTAAHELYLSLGYRRLPDRDRRNQGGEQIVFHLALGEPSEGASL